MLNVLSINTFRTPSLKQIASLLEECQAKESCLFPCSPRFAREAQNALKFTHLGGNFSVLNSNTAVKTVSFGLLEKIFLSIVEIGRIDYLIFLLKG